MAVNIVELVMQQLSPELIGRLGTSLGLDRGTAQQAVGASVPALLAGFAGLASTPGGAERLAGATVQHEPNVLDSVSRAIGGTGQQALTESGSGLLSSLFGSGMMGQLVNAMARYCGIGTGSAQSMLGTLAPVVLAVLGGQQRSGGLDANGLARLLGDQRDQIASALPSGLADSLGTTGFLGAARERLSAGATAASARVDALSASAHDAAADAGRAASNVAAAAQSTARPASSMRWLYGLGALIVLAAIGWYLFGGTARQDVARVPTAPEAPSGAAPTNFTVGNVDLRAQASTAVNNVRSALQDVTDTASAQAALPKLQEATAQLDQVTQLAGQLPGESKRALAGMIGTAMPTLKELIAKAMDQPGVRDVLKPAADALQSKLETLAQA